MLKDKKERKSVPFTGHYSDSMIFKVIALIVTLISYGLFFLVPASSGLDTRWIYLITAFLSIALSVIKKRRWWRGWLIIFWMCYLVGSFMESSLVMLIISLYVYMILMLAYLITAIFSPSAEDPVYQQRKQVQEQKNRMK